MIAIPSQLLQCIYSNEELIDERKNQLKKTIDLILGLFFATCTLYLYPFVAKIFFNQPPHPHASTFANMMLAVAILVIILSLLKFTIIMHAYTPIKGPSLIEFLQSTKSSEEISSELQKKSIFYEQPLYTQKGSTDPNIYSEQFNTLYFFSSKNPCLLALVKRVHQRENRELAPIEMQQIIEFFITQNSLSTDDQF